MQRISVVERPASFNDDEAAKNSMVDDVQNSQIACDTAARPVMYRIKQVSCAMFVHPKPYLSIGSARDTLTEAMFEVREVEGPSCAISTPFAIRATSDGCFSFPILLRIRLNELPRSDETLSVVKLSHDDGVDDGELLEHHMAESLEVGQQFVQIELYHFCKIVAIRKVVQSEVDGEFADASRLVVSIYNPTDRTIGFKGTNYEMTVGAVDGRNLAVEGGLSVLPIQASCGGGTSSSQSIRYTCSAETFEELIRPKEYVLVYMDHRKTECRKREKGRARRAEERMRWGRRGMRRGSAGGH
mmetsp:Transcript_37485/g.93211  ORF Transcript_37485/g.93211 Transcript_37485/m.93211 type:complete len:300 (+) Transcript_37485:433-1332(+)